MPKDEVFKEVGTGSADFKFGANVVAVFDDMVTRSVPFYIEIQRMISEMVQDFGVSGTNVYDLGCSTGTTFLNIDKILPKDITFIGIDNSQEMLDKCEKNLREAGVSRNLELKFADLNKGIHLENASIVIMCLTLQFVRPLYREKLIKNIYEQLNTNGCLIVVEKVLGEYSLFNRLFIKYYYDMKRRHNYSEIEISQKREALENVLIPYKLEENKELLFNTGFRYVDTFFKWYNFSGIIAVK
ncbi:MAG: carboxy-S-adenosyl-L-methionine synthase CmoA [Flammeovirgaceae bacterium]